MKEPRAIVRSSGFQDKHRVLATSSGEMLSHTAPVKETSATGAFFCQLLAPIGTQLHSVSPGGFSILNID